MKTIALPENIYRELIGLKISEGAKTSAELIGRLLLKYKHRKFLEASALFNKKLKEKNLSLLELLKRARKAREEIADEWFAD